MKKPQFPFAKDEAGWNDGLKHTIDGIGEDVIDALRAYKPWWKGNDQLRGLHELDLIDKHRLLVPTLFAVVGRVRIPGLHDMAFGHGAAITERMRISLRADLQMPHLVEVAEPPTAVFQRDIDHFSGRAVVPTLNAFADMVEEIIELFAAKFSWVEPRAPPKEPKAIPEMPWAPLIDISF